MYTTRVHCAARVYRRCVEFLSCVMCHVVWLGSLLLYLYHATYVQGGLQIGNILNGHLVKLF